MAATTKGRNLVTWKKRNRLLNNAMKNQSGFTLLELLIGIAIIAVAAAFAFPDLMAFMDNYQLKKAASRLYNDMQYTRLNAIKQGKDWAIVFDAANTRYYICSDRGGDNSWAIAQNTIEETVDLPDRGGVAYGNGSATKDATDAGGNSFSDDYITFNNNYATFNSLGAGTSGYVYLQNNNNGTYAVGKESTGFITIKRWQGGDWK